jgi:hypothetical protein
MSMYGSYKSSPRQKAAIDAALKSISSGVRKTGAEAKAEREAFKQKSMADVKARNEKSKAEGIQRERDTAKKDAADLPNLQKRHAEMEATYNKGKNYQYADREQNLSDEERTARDMQGSMNQMAQRIQNVKKYGYKQGGKISLKDCGVSTASKSKTNCDW